MPSRVVVLVSGSGTLLQSLIDDVPAATPYTIEAVVSDRVDAYGLARAEAAGIATVTVLPADYADRAAWDRALADVVASSNPDWVVCAGFMRILGPSMLSVFPGRIVNTHPALLPSFPGAHGVRDALAYGVHVTGCTVHLVDVGVDTGPILAQEAVTISPGETEDDLHERIKVVERRMLVDVVSRLSAAGYTVDGRKVTIP